MSLQGQLRDFSALEILQLLGSQRKTGCLTLEGPQETLKLWLHEGRLVSSRTPAPVMDDTLVRFLRRTRRLSDAQYKGLTELQRETGRDAEDLIRAGRYVTEDDLATFIERMILDDLSRAVSWEQGRYAFDPAARWTATPLVSMNVESGLMEAARRCDELKRFGNVFTDPQQLLAPLARDRDVESLGADEDVMLAAVDGEHTLAELLADAPMLPFEAQDALARLLEADVIGFSGRREASALPAPQPPTRTAIALPGLGRELVAALAVALIVVVARLSSHGLEQLSTTPRDSDVYAAAAVRDIRATIELYAREHGHLPARLSDLSEDRWIEERHLHVPGQVVRYRVLPGGADYELGLQPDR